MQNMGVGLMLLEKVYGSLPAYCRDMYKVNPSESSETTIHRPGERSIDEVTGFMGQRAKVIMRYRP